MSQLGEVKVPVTFEMTETSKQVLRDAIIQILRDPDVVNELARTIEQWIVSRMRYGRNPQIEVSPLTGQVHRAIEDREEEQ
jgi:hypothetical protein